MSIKVLYTSPKTFIPSQNKFLAKPVLIRTKIIIVNASKVVNVNEAYTTRVRCRR